MANDPHPNRPEQSFADAERLFRRIRKENIGRNGKPTLLAFALPDMSVHREKDGSAEDARRGFDKADWAVAAFIVGDIPPRTDWQHLCQLYRLLARHVPMPGNFAHSEVRVWRRIEEVLVLVTGRQRNDFAQDDPDRDCRRDTPETLLDPDSHLRWRKHIALASKMVLPCEGNHA